MDRTSVVSAMLRLFGEAEENRCEGEAVQEGKGIGGYLLLFLSPILSFGGIIY